MDINLVIAHLRAGCPSFAGRIAGAIEFKAIPATQALAIPSAFVIPLEDNPDPPSSLNAVRQKLTESFAVVVALSNTLDERGQAPATSLHGVRAELWKALLGWRLTDDYNGVNYEGGSLMELDRSRMWYRFEFGAEMEIGPSDGWEEGYLESLPTFETVHVKVDVIDPIADPNLQQPGPDGRIEFELDVTNLNPPVP